MNIWTLNIVLAVICSVNPCWEDIYYRSWWKYLGEWLWMFVIVAIGGALYTAFFIYFLWHRDTPIGLDGWINYVLSNVILMCLYNGIMSFGRQEDEVDERMSSGSYCSELPLRMAIHSTISFFLWIVTWFVIWYVRL